MTRLQELQKQADEHRKKRPKDGDYVEGQGWRQNPEYTEWRDEEYRLQKLIGNEYKLERCNVFSEIHIPKALSLKLALHGFNEKCYRTFYKKHSGLKEMRRYWGYNHREIWNKQDLKDPWPEPYDLYSPTFDQVTDWFREKYDIDFIMSPKIGREKKYQCDPVGPGLGNVRLQLSDGFREAQLRAFEYLLTKVKPLPKKTEVEEDEDAGVENYGTAENY